MKPVFNSYKISRILRSLLRSPIRFARLVKLAKILFMLVMLVFDESNKWECKEHNIGYIMVQGWKFRHIFTYKKWIGTQNAWPPQSQNIGPRPEGSSTDWICQTLARRPDGRRRPPLRRRRGVSAPECRICCISSHLFLYRSIFLSWKKSWVTIKERDQSVTQNQ